MKKSKKDGSKEYLEASGTMIGAFDFSDWQQETRDIQPGDQILVFTDGVVEADRSGAHYGDERLEKLVVDNRHQTPDNLINSIIRDVTRFVAGESRSDDITMVAIRRN